MRLTPAKLGLVCALGALALVSSVDCGGDSPKVKRNGGAGGAAGDESEGGGSGGSGGSAGRGGSGGAGGSSSSAGSAGASAGSGGASAGGSAGSSAAGGSGGALSCSGAGGAPASTRKPNMREKTECQGDAVKHCDAGDGLCIEMPDIATPTEDYCLSAPSCGPCPAYDTVVGECDTVDPASSKCLRTLFYETKYDAGSANGQCANGFVGWQMSTM